MSSIQMNSDRTIKSKSDEVDSLKSKILEEINSKDRLMKEKSDEIASIKKELRAEYELVSQLSKNVGVARADVLTFTSTGIVATYYSSLYPSVSF